MNTNELLDSLKERLDITSEKQLAEDVFHIRLVSLKEMRQRGLSDDRALEVAKALNLDPGLVLAWIHAERSKNAAVRAAWEKMAQALKQSAAGLLWALAFSLALCFAPMRPAHAAVNAAGHVYYVKLRRFLNRLFLLALLFFSSSVASMAADTWSRRDTALEAAVITVTAADWMQTRYISAHPDLYSETNGILGPHPSMARIDNYFSLCIVSHVLITHFLPSRYRPLFQSASLAVELSVTAHNRALGIRFNF